MVTGTRDRLVDAAVHVYRRSGPGGSGLADVCTEAGVTKGVFTHHFPGGKDELLLAAIDRNVAEVDRLLDRQLATSASVGDAVRSAFGAYADLLDRDPDLGCPVAASVVDASSSRPAVRARTGEAFGRWRDRLARALGDAGRPGEEAADLAATVVATLEGAILLARAASDPEVLRRCGRWLGQQVDGG